MSGDGAAGSKKQILSSRIRVLDRVDGEKGPSRCRNLGADAARGEFLLFLDSDDLLAPTCLAERLEAAETEPDFDLWVFPAGTFVETPGDSEQLWGIMDLPRNDAERFAGGDAPWHTSSPVWRKSAFRNLGGFNERILYGDDADLHLRALLASLRIRQFPDRAADIFVRRSDEARITNTLDDTLLHSRRVRLKEGNRLLREPEVPLPLREIWEGQHIVEAEFLLFRDQGCADIESVLSLWRDAYSPSPLRRLIVISYVQFALLTRNRAYLLLRLARRLAIAVLPRAYFP